jgi:hypothetical protein
MSMHVILLMFVAIFTRSAAPLDNPRVGLAWTPTACDADLLFRVVSEGWHSLADTGRRR